MKPHQQTRIVDNHFWKFDFLDYDSSDFFVAYHKFFKCLTLETALFEKTIYFFWIDMTLNNYITRVPESIRFELKSLRNDERKIKTDLPMKCRFM